MAIWIEQRFVAGRFHATRWRQNPFEDIYGEWPPSPWRLLRALAARWFQYARETGDEDEGRLQALLGALAGELPGFYLPDLVWRGRALKQYQPTGLAWSDPAANAAAIKRTATTLVADTYWCISPNETVVWSWPELQLDSTQRVLLAQLLRRLLYFGRAESLCEMKLLDGPPHDSHRAAVELQPGASSGQATSAPVLTALPGQYRHDVLLANTGSQLLKNQPVPPGTGWRYATLPARPRIKPEDRRREIAAQQCLQFAVGGRVYPRMAHWVRVTEAFRQEALKLLRRDNGWSEESQLKFCGHDRQYRPCENHEHPYFVLWPDGHGEPTRLIVWRKQAFEATEVELLWSACEYALEYGVFKKQASIASLANKPRSKRSSEWALRLVPLPLKTTLPPGFKAPSRQGARVWESATPFVPPAQRFRFRKSGKLRMGETVERIAQRLVEALGLPAATITNLDTPCAADATSAWLDLHMTRDRRRQYEQSRTRLARPGYWLRLEFSEPFEGPLALGDSSHFGLGAFRACE